MDKAKHEELRVHAALAGKELQESVNIENEVSKGTKKYAEEVAARMEQKKREILKKAKNG